MELGFLGLVICILGFSVGAYLGSAWIMFSSVLGAWISLKLES